MKDYKKVIELGIKKAEQNYDDLKKHEEVTKKRGTIIDNESRTASIDGKVVTFDEIYDKFLENESFVGTKVNQEPLQRFFVMAKAARQLGEEHRDIKGVQIIEPSKDTKYGIAIVKVNWMASFRKTDVELFRELFNNADSFYVSGIKDGVFNMSFFVNDVYS